MEIFNECHVALKNNKTAGLERSAAGDLLRRLGYWDGSAELGKTGSNSQQNQQALLGLAAGFRDFFELPVRQTAGLHIAGALLDPRVFGISGNGHNRPAVSGRGFTFAQAFESCVGEAAEYLSFIERDLDPLIASAATCNELSQDDLEWAWSGIGLDNAVDLTEVSWIEAISLVDHRKVWFPSEVVLRRPSNRRAGSRQAESNGVGAGSTIEEAQLSGLLEIVERDAVALWWFGGLRAKEVSWGSPGQKKLRSKLTALRETSNRPHWFLDLTTDVGVPVAACLSSDCDGRAVVGGFSANSDLSQAVEGAFLEMCQMEVGLELAVSKLEAKPDRKLLPQDQVWINRYNRLNVDNFPHLRSTSGFPGGDLAPVDREVEFGPLPRVVRQLHRSGFTPYFVNITRSEIAVPVAKMLVPGLQSAKPDWRTRRLIEMAEKSGTSLMEIDELPSPI